MKKVLFITNIPSPYRVQFFNELGKKTELTVLFEKSFSNERDDSWKNYRFDNFNGIIMKGIDRSTDSAFCPQICKYISRKYDFIIVSNISTPTGILAVNYMRLMKIEYYVEGDGGYPKSGKGIKEKIKHFIISGAKGCFSTGKTHDEYYLTYGAKKENIYSYPFSSVKRESFITRNFDDVDTILENKKICKQNLDIKEEKMILTIGQFIERKGFDVLLKAVKLLPENVGVYFVGGVPTDEYKELAKGLENVHFVGFKKPTELSEYYKSADVFVLPTREDIWGLVVNEALSFALPVVTTDKCIAGCELIKVGKNGYIVPVENAEELAEKTKKILDITACDEYKKMATACLEIADEYTIEGMVERHLEIIDAK